MKKRKVVFASLGIVCIVAMTVGIGLYIFLNANIEDPDDPITIKRENRITSFKNEGEFKNYIASAQQSGYWDTMQRGGGVGLIDMVTDDVLPPLAFSPGLDGTSKETSDVQRYSQTNVQVLMIDEADIVKTDGRNLYYSPERNWYDYPLIIEDGVDIGIPRNENQTGRTYIIDALPPEDVKVFSQVSKNGKLYIEGNTLIVEGNDNYQAYDVSNESSPRETWSYQLESGQRIISSRLYEKELYVVVGMYISTYRDCSIPIMTDNRNNTVAIRCTDIYYPPTQLHDLQNITVVKIDAQNGDILGRVSFMGSEWNTIIYMSHDNLYVTYPQEGDLFEEVYTFIMDNQDIFTQSMIDRFALIKGYDISSSTKMIEVESILERYVLSLSQEDRLKFENDLNNRFQTYLKSNIRSFGGTGIVKLSLRDLSIKSNAIVQGHLLNQFSLDEYNGFLRVATTRSGSWWGRWFSGQIESASDVVVMDESLNVVGEVTDLGLTERIYSVRFIGDKGYVVTFRQIDPFYVLDLSKPTSPEMKGELKIPGYSSYLHPMNDKTILGIGMEDGRVKLSLFDVSRPSNPIEINKYSMNDYWTDIENNHHAFMHDPENELFFIPASSGGYVFSYEGNSLNIVKVITDNTQVKRALYINDNLYVLSNSNLLVFDMKSWQKVSDLILE